MNGMRCHYRGVHTDNSMPRCEWRCLQTKQKVLTFEQLPSTLLVRFNKQFSRFENVTDKHEIQLLRKKNAKQKMKTDKKQGIPWSPWILEFKETNESNSYTSFCFSCSFCFFCWCVRTVAMGNVAGISKMSTPTLSVILTRLYRLLTWRRYTMTI